MLSDVPSTYDLLAARAFNFDIPTCQLMLGNVTSCSNNFTVWLRIARNSINLLAVLVVLQSFTLLELHQTELTLQVQVVSTTFFLWRDYFILISSLNRFELNYIRVRHSILVDIELITLLHEDCLKSLLGAIHVDASHCDIRRSVIFLRLQVSLGRLLYPSLHEVR